jgi:hypothetical protein
MPQVMLPYMVVGIDGEAVYSRYLENQQLALTAGAS